ncbi:MAG: hypothetical protein J07HX5_01250, partial [halophilic archaeon J07HX5]
VVRSVAGFATLQLYALGLLVGACAVVVHRTRTDNKQPGGDLA